MALFLDNTTVYHPGRTGGHWLRANLYAMGLVSGESNGLHDSPLDLLGFDQRAKNSQIVCFIRHPLTWIRSLWIHETQFGWTNADLAPTNEFGSFDAYIEDITKRYPKGICSHYFQPFLDAATHVGRYETLQSDSCRILKECGFSVSSELPYSKPINVSSPDGIVRAAKATPAILERYLESELEYCSKYGYGASIPNTFILDDKKTASSWFPIFPAVQTSQSQLLPSSTTNTFRFSDKTTWPGARYYRRSQLAFIEALKRRSAEGLGDFCELGAGDGYYVFLAEQLGALQPIGISIAENANAVVACQYLSSAANFDTGNPVSYSSQRDFHTILIRDQLNHTPWPHLLLLNAKRLLKDGGQLILGSLVFEHMTNAPVSIMVTEDLFAILPKTCPYLMSESYLRHMFVQCGLQVEEECCRYEEPSYGESAKTLISSGAAKPGMENLIRIVWRLSSRHTGEFDDELAFWQHGNPISMVDLNPQPRELLAYRTINSLYEETKVLRNQNEALTAALHDREVDLSREREEIQTLNNELIDRTKRLERALAELGELEG
jgi:SAM-dependent methyltransferase